MREKSTSFKSLFGGLIAIGLVALFAVFQFGPVDLSMLPSFDRGGELPIVAELDAVGKVQILDAEMGASSEFRLTSIEPDAAMIQTASIREAVKMMAGPPCDVVDCAATGMPFTVTAPNSGCGSLVQEAEAGTISGGFQIGTDSVASGGQFVHVPNGSGNRGSGPDESQKMSYCFTVTQAGTYRINTQVYANSASSNSFWAKVNSLPANGHFWSMPVSSAYVQDYVADIGVADPVEVVLGVGDHTVDIYLREDGTRLDSIELELISASGGGPTCTGLVQEAETGELNGMFAIGNDAAANGGQYVHVPNGSGNRGSGPDESQKVSYCFTVTQAGTYQIKATIYSDSASSNSFWAKVNALPANGHFWSTSVNSAYVVDYVSDSGIADPVEVTLGVGDHIIDIYLREDGARLDKLELDLVSSGGGSPVCAGLSQEAEAGVLSGLFVAVNDANANGGQYIHVPNGGGNRGSGPDEDQKASYCVTVTQADTYRIKARIHAESATSNSFWVRVNATPTTGYYWSIPANNAYVDDYVAGVGIADPVEVTLGVGDHFIDFYLREDGTRLDSFELEPVTVAAASLPRVAQDLNSTANVNISGQVLVEADASNDLDIDTLLGPGLPVVVRDKRTGGRDFTITVLTDKRGYYFIDEIAPGEYVVTVEVPNGIQVRGTLSQTVSAVVNEESRAIFDLNLVASDEYSGDGESTTQLFLPVVR